MSDFDLDVVATVDQLAILQARLRHRGSLTGQERNERAKHLRVLERTAPQAALILEAQIHAGTQSILHVRDSGDVLLWSDGKTAEARDPRRAMRRWRVDAYTLECLRPAADG